MAHRMLAPRDAATDDDEDFEQENQSEVDSLASENNEVVDELLKGNTDSINLAGHALDFDNSLLDSEEDTEIEHSPQTFPAETDSTTKPSEVVDQDVKLLQKMKGSPSEVNENTVTTKKENEGVEDVYQRKEKDKKSGKGIVEVHRRSRQVFDVPTTGDFYMHDDRAGAVNTTTQRSKTYRNSGEKGIDASRWKHDKFEEMEREHQQNTNQRDYREIPTYGGRWMKNKQTPSWGRGRGRGGSRFQGSTSNRGRGQAGRAPSRGYRGGGRTYSGRFGNKYPSTSPGIFSTANTNDNGWSL